MRVANPRTPFTQHHRVRPKAQSSHGTSQREPNAQRPFVGARRHTLQARGMLRHACEVGQLFRVVGQVEELGPVHRRVDVLVLPATDHQQRLERPLGVVLGQHRVGPCD